MKKEEWIERIARRSDITSNLVHLTKGAVINGKEVGALEILINILKEQRINGSDTESGFIVGSRKAVCLQESPVYSLSENTYYEQKLFKENKTSKRRYYPIGIAFSKPYIFNKGGRPVIYDKTSEAKGYLPSNQWWRIVNYDLSNDNNYIDWTHEREWRVPERLEFELEDIRIVVVKHSNIEYLKRRCNEENIDINKVKSIIVLSDILY